MSRCRDITKTCSDYRFELSKQVHHDRRTHPTRRSCGSRRLPGRSGDRTSANGSGEPCARTTAKAATPGTTSRHDQARSRAYRWGEDGLAGISDDKQRLCFALALWNGKDPILKERLFGLTNSESNHGEDVKEYYFYLDSTPTHSYMKYLYKYPQAAFPYADLVETSRRRGRHEFEYELLDTGVFDQDRYFDVFVEYAKESPEDILIQITVHNRGPEPAELHVLPTLWFRNQWSWHDHPDRPSLCQADEHAGAERRQGRRSQTGRTLPLLRRRRAPAVHGERNQHPAHLRRSQPHARTSRTASTTTSSTARRRRSIRRRRERRSRPIIA